MSFDKMHGLHAATPRITHSRSICEMFTGAEGGSAIVSIHRTPGGRDRHAVITVNPAASAKIGEISSERRAFGSYEEDPKSYEHDARLAFLDAVPEMTSALMFAKTAGAVIIEVRGLPRPAGASRTPHDGIVVEPEIRSHIFNLVGSLTGSLSLQGFSYASENGGRLLRAVSPVVEVASQASSQGFADDLGWHQDNANRSFVSLSYPRSHHRGPMNDYQAFVCIRADERVPMDVAGLEDIVTEVSHRHGSSLIDMLHEPHFSISRPDSHGGGLDVEGVPLLARDGHGRLHGRFHAGNVIGFSPAAQEAYDVFKRVSLESSGNIEIEGEEGALLVYANTRVMHRRRKYQPRFDGNDRYYVRVYMMESDDLRSWKSHLNGRVFN